MPGLLPQLRAVSQIPARWRRSAQPTGYGWAIRINDREVFSLQHDRQIGLGMLHAVRSLLYAQGRYDVALHAGMVPGDDYGLLPSTVWLVIRALSSA